MSNHDFTHAGRFAAGERIRAYDFPGRKDSFLEGIVKNPDGRMLGDQPVPCYVLTIERQVFGGEDITQPCDTGYVPHKTWFGESEERIVRVSVLYEPLEALIAKYERMIAARHQREMDRLAPLIESMADEVFYPNHRRLAALHTAAEKAGGA
jgi:hypothetical protein